MKKQTEDGFQRTVIEFAQLHGWMVAHFRPGPTKSGNWRTAVQGDGAGFPDLVMVRQDRCVAMELKVVGGKVSDEQQRWLEAFDEAGIENYLCWPEDWKSIEEILS